MSNHRKLLARMRLIAEDLAILTSEHPNLSWAARGSNKPKGLWDTTPDPEFLAEERAIRKIRMLIEEGRGIFSELIRMLREDGIDTSPSQYVRDMDDRAESLTPREWADLMARIFGDIQAKCLRLSND